MTARMGGYYGPGSYCAESTLDNSAEEMNGHLCYHMDCVDSKVAVTVGEVTKICETDGEDLTFDGFNGKLTCPKAAILCGIIHPRFTPTAGFTATGVFSASGQGSPTKEPFSASRRFSKSFAFVSSASLRPTRPWGVPVIVLEEGSKSLPSMDWEIKLSGKGTIRPEEGNEELMIKGISLESGSDIEAVDLVVEDLSLDGSAKIRAASGSRLLAKKSLTFTVQGNDKFPQIDLGHVEDAVPSEIRIQFDGSDFDDVDLEEFRHDLILGTDWAYCSNWKDIVRFDDNSEYFVLECEEEREDEQRADDDVRNV
jgi:hypothetical protein